jgi:hypothetical protein
MREFFQNGDEREFRNSEQYIEQLNKCQILKKAKLSELSGVNYRYKKLELSLLTQKTQQRP